jgi:hypothetical protein
MESPGEQETPLFLQEPNTMFADPECIKLLEDLTPLFKCVTSELWGFLWMSDKEMLRKMAENTTYMGLALESGLKTGKPILYCECMTCAESKMASNNVIGLQRIRLPADSAAVASAASSVAPSPKRPKTRSTTPIFPSPLRSPAFNPSPMPPQPNTRSRDVVELVNST